MDPKYTGETLKHLEKESELLLNAHKAMSDELHRLQVEEEMLMRKFHELMSAHGLTKKKDLNDNAEGRQNGQEGALVDMINGADERQNDLEGTKGLPSVLFVLPDSYVDPENKDYGARYIQ